MKLRTYIIYIISIVLLGCSPHYHLDSSEHKIIGISAEKDSAISSIIAPYKKAIESQMNEVLSYNKKDLTKKKGNNLLARFVTDLSLEYANADICIMNNGGLRTIIHQGPVTRGKIFELMPFENELVIVELDEKDFTSLLDYIAIRNGDIPFSGIEIKINEKKEVLSHNKNINFSKGEKIKVLTSDYLANGGDKMKFLQNKQQIKIGIKVRDAIIDYCERTDTINMKLDSRIQIINEEE